MRQICRFIFLLMALILGVLDVSAQQQKDISGRIIDKESGEIMEKTTLQLFRVSRKNQKTDTTFVSGAFSDSQGRFSFKGISSGQYLLRI